MVYIPALSVASIPLWEMLKRNSFSCPCHDNRQEKMSSSTHYYLGTRWK